MAVDRRSRRRARIGVALLAAASLTMSLPARAQRIPVVRFPSLTAPSGADSTAPTVAPRDAFDPLPPTTTDGRDPNGSDASSTNDSTAASSLDAATTGTTGSTVPATGIDANATGTDGTGIAPGDAIPGDAIPGESTRRPMQRARPPRTSQLDVGVRSSVTYSNNIGRNATDPQPGWVGEVSPYAVGQYQSPRARADMYLSLRSFFRNVGADSVAQPEARASGAYAIVDDFLWLSGSAAVYAYSPDPTGALSFDPAVYSQNVEQYRSFSLSPYIRTRLGNFANMRVQYTHTFTSTSNDALVARFDRRLAFTLDSGPRFSNWTWESSAQVQRQTLNNGLAFARESASVTLYRVFGAQFRFGVTGAYEHIEGLRNEDGEDSGYGGGVRFTWAPSRRTSLSAAYLRQYYGDDVSVDLTHRFSRLSFGVGYRQNVLTGSDASLLLIDPASLYSAGGFSAELNPVFQSLASQALVQTFASPAGVGVMGGGIARNKTLTAQVGYASTREAIAATLFNSVRETALDATALGLGTGLVPGLAGRVTQRGMNLTWEHRLSVVSFLNLSGQYALIEQEIPYTRSRLATAQVSYRRRLTKATSASIGVIRNRQRGDGAAALDYDEAAVFGAFDARF
ncbi:MAG: TIGR03016 family PEP-CTERM system-associated outer membrane protein [Burkholderiaceae bacterium]|nr:TIGR03016 family PEP-CTERM system-associated outer membrane protein [Burkholderiaceae bacterium]